MESLHNEALLVQAMQSGNEEAFTALYRHYSPQLYLNILKLVRDPLLAEEMVQELFTRIWLKRENKGLKENFAGYIYRTGQHLVHDFFRKLKRDRHLLERFRSFAETHYEHIEELLQQQESSALLRQAIERLSPQQKKVYELVKVEGCTYKKAAEIMGISPLTVKEYLTATNKSIRSYVLNHLDGAAGLLLCMALFCRLG
jgi:RNA polymerase sigma-70 factor (ECF subfamily)